MRNMVLHLLRFSPINRSICPGKASQSIPCLSVRGKKQTPKGKVFFSRASLTVESAFVLPLFLFACLSLISLMDLYRLETIHLTDLCSKTKTAATYTYNPAGDGLTDIVLADVYRFTPVSCLIPAGSIPCGNLVKVRSWNGKAHLTANHIQSSGNMVYVTVTGTVFHRSLGCRYLNLSLTSIPASEIATRRNSSGGRYEPCELCVGSGGPAGLVYITKKGNRYHNSQNCSGLKRTIRIVRESDVAGMRACSNCG